MVALPLRKKKICAVAVLTIMLNENVDEYTGRRFWVSKRYGIYHILTNELRIFDKEYFFRFVRMTPQRFEHLFFIGWISFATNSNKNERIDFSC